MNNLAVRGRMFVALTVLGLSAGCGSTKSAGSTAEIGCITAVATTTTGTN